MARKAKVDAEKTRERILSRALSLFVKKGYENTAFNDIAAGLKMTKGAVYWHFESKGDLLCALLSEAMARFSATLSEHMEGRELTFPAVAEMLLESAGRIISDKSRSEFFMLMQPGAIFINASRGEVMNEDALKAAYPKLGAAIIDTWNNEPDVDEDLIELVDVATPHIAGYSFQGKQNGTASAVQSVAHHFGIEELYDYYPENDIPDHEPKLLDLKDKKQGEIAAVFQYNYPIFTADFRFRMEPGNFEKMRSNYQYRREFYVE
jgi:AcrR family transcriptional regulator